MRVVMAVITTAIIPITAIILSPQCPSTADSSHLQPSFRVIPVLAESSSCRDIYPDTWVGTDALGRVTPTSQDVGPVKTDAPRVVGIFYVTWHRGGNSEVKDSYVADVTKVLKGDPIARLDDKHKLWKPGLYYHWGEPEVGYFLSKDRYVIRKDMSMLSDAGVDVLIMDVTNAVRYWEEWDTVFSVMEEMRAEGNNVPRFCFWAFNGPVYTVVQDLYERIYLKNQHKDLWFIWDGKPLLLYNNTGTNDGGEVVQSPNPHYDSTAASDPGHPHYGDPYYAEKLYTDYTAEVKNFFTGRTMWWGFYEWNGKRFIGTEGNWSYGYQMNDERVKRLSPDELVSHQDSIKEQAAVTPAQHVPTNLSMAGKSWSKMYGEPELNRYDLPESAFVGWLGKWVKQPEGYGIYFQERWDDALKADPRFIYINDWNEWTAYFYQIPNGGTTPFMRRISPFFFVDQYNAEFNRDIQPMKDGYTDNYYMQMVQNIRRYKGARPIPVLKGSAQLDTGRGFPNWERIEIEYRDTRGDTFHRDHKGYYGKHYVDDSGRNDILTCKVAVDENSVYFYAETVDTLTSHTGRNWMLLLLDVDRNTGTGWFGYDFVVNKRIVNETATTVMRYDQSSQVWIQIAELSYHYSGKRLELAVPRTLLGLASKASCIFDFHWCDNPADLNSPISLCTSGDSAPNRRFNYRCRWTE